MSSSLLCVYIAIPIPCFYGFWHGASLHLHTFYENVFVLVSLVFSIHCIHVCVEKGDWEMYVWCNLSKEAFPEQGKVCMTDVTLRRHRRRRVARWHRRRETLY